MEEILETEISTEESIEGNETEISTVSETPEAGAENTEPENNSEEASTDVEPE